MGRSSYRSLSRMPAWGLYDAQGRLIATVRARSAWEAREIFREHRNSLLPAAVKNLGLKVRKVGAPDEGVSLLRPTGESV